MEDLVHVQLGVMERVVVKSIRDDAERRTPDDMAPEEYSGTDSLLGERVARDSPDSHTHMDTRSVGHPIIDR